MRITFFIFLISVNFSLAQKVESIYVLTKKEKFNNHYKNYTDRDSLVLYKDSTFRRESNYWGFDEIDQKILFGKWKFSKESLLLKVKKRADSSQTIMLNETQIIKRNQLRKYKKSNQ